MRVKNQESRIKNQKPQLLLSFWNQGYIKNEERGFAPILVIGVVVLIALFAFLYFFFMRNNQQLDNFRASDIPPGIVTDAEGNICETQDAEFCHESEDIETWKDDGLP